MQLVTIILDSAVLGRMEELNMISVVFGNKQQGKIETNKKRAEHARKHK